MPSFDPLYLSPGSLRHILTVVQPQESNVNGVPSTTTTTVLTTRCSIDMATTKEIAATAALGGSVTSQVTHSIKLRYTPINIAPGMTAQVLGNSYSIQSAENVQGRNRVLNLLVLAVNEAA